jgi:hypothetical protein
LLLFSRENLEPFSIANYYRLRLHTRTGHYLDVRPKAFEEIETTYCSWATKMRLTTYADSTVWARNMQEGRSNDGVDPVCIKELQSPPCSSTHDTRHNRWVLLEAADSVVAAWAGS